MHVIATAGHVDHGKSTLVKELSGIDPDRLAQEKARGLTIDLGFAWIKLNDLEVGVVDVPGHERFIKNMLAGVGSVGAVLFVVDAAEGWKPQSQEHLDIVDILGISSGVVAITKIDTVDDERVTEVAKDIARRLEATTLSGTEMIPVSAKTKIGLRRLTSALNKSLLNAAPPKDDDRPRMWIDRAFSIKGSGTVVTGTLTGGSINEGDSVLIEPAGIETRVRGLQSHNKARDSVGPGNRTAINLGGVGSDQIVRGDALVRGGQWKTTARLLGSIKLVADQPKLYERGAFKFHVGSVERSASLRILSEDKERFSVAISLDRPVILDWADRFVIREIGRRVTLGGGTVLDPHPVSLRRSSAIAAAESLAGIDDRAGYSVFVLQNRGWVSKRELARLAGTTPDESQPGVRLLGEWAISDTHFVLLESNLLAAITKFHEASPLEQGLSREHAKSVLDLPEGLFDEFVQELVEAGKLRSEETSLSLPSHTGGPSGPERLRLLNLLAESGASPPTMSDLKDLFESGLFRALERTGDLIRVSSELVYPAEVMADIKSEVKKLIEAKGPVTVAAFRDLFGTSRKYAIPLLEYLDQIGFTRRDGDERRLGPNS